MPEERSQIAIAEDVARLANVSLSSVSRAFTPGESVAPKTRERILAAAAEVGYRPNQIARSLMRGRSNIVGVGVGNLTNPFLSAALDALTIRLSLVGLRLLLFATDNASIVEASIDEVLQYRLDAVILLGVSPSDHLLTECDRARVPVILFNRRGDEGGGASGVSGDNDGGGRSIAAFLAAGQHKRFAFIAGIGASQASRERGEGYACYLAENGYSEPIVEEGRHTYSDASAATRRLLLARERPDAIFCANDLMAMAAMDVARSEFGLDVGREVSIVGFDDVAMAQWPSFALTTYAQSTEAMVDEMIALIQIARSGGAPSNRIVGGSLVIRSSARRPGNGP